MKHSRASSAKRKRPQTSIIPTSCRSIKGATTKTASRSRSLAGNSRRAAACRKQAPRCTTSRRDALVAGISEPFCARDWALRRSFPVEGPESITARQTRGISSPIGTLPVNSFIPAKYSEPSPPVSVEVSMREIEGIQQQPIPTYRSACFRLWQSRFAFLRVNFARIYFFVTFT